MRRFIWATAYFAGGIAAGCFSAFALIQSAGVQPVEAGPPWLSRAAAMNDDQSFYVRAHYLLEGRLPPAPGQMIEATAETDGDGRPLTGTCIYRVSSTGPLPAWWSLSIVGEISARAPLQATADSDTALRNADGSVSIIASHRPQPGNWLEVPDERRLTLLYSALPSGRGSSNPPFSVTRELLVKRHLFWAAVALAAAIAAHAGFALYVPGWWFSREVMRLAHAHGDNSFFILTPSQQARLFPGLPRSGVTGLCVFDVTQGDVVFSANLPEGFWITTIYTDKVQPIYSVNNRQSGANSFNVSLSRAPGLIEQILKATDKESTDELDSGWTVTSPEPRGLAVVWYPTPETGLRTLAAEAVARSRCTAQQPAS